MAEKVPPQELEQAFDRIWKEIRAARLYAGQPRSETSAQSVSLAYYALQLAADSGRKRLLIEAWRMLAYSLTANEQFEDAIPYYKRSIEGLEQAGEAAQAARSKLGYIAALYHLGRYPEALDVVRTAEEWFRENKDESGLARLCTNVANLYDRLDDHAQSYRYHLMAVETFEKIGDQQALAQAYLNLGTTLTFLDSFENAEAMYEKCETVSRDMGMLDLSVQAQYNRAYLHFLRGRYSDALQSFARLRQHFQESGSRHYALCDLDEAGIYIQLNLSNDAAALATRAAEHFKALGLKYEEAKATAFYGFAMVQMGRYSEAQEVFRSAQKIFEDEGNLYWMGLLDLYRAEVHLTLHRPGEAQRLAMHAKATFQQLAIPSKTIFSLVLLGRVALALNDLNAAKQCTEEISALIEATTMPLVLFPYHVLCGELAERMRNRNAAQHHYEFATQDLEQHQARLHHDDLRVTFLRGRQQAYDALIRLSLDRMDTLEGIESAFAWCERARSRGLIELLSNSAPSGQGRPEPSLVAKINRLREELNISYARSRPELRSLPSSSNFETIALKEQELARSLREISGLDPEYASLQQVSIATIDSVRKRIPERSTLVEFFTTGDEILVFILSPDKTRVIHPLCPAGLVASLQERLGFQLENFMLERGHAATHSRKILETTRRRLQELYQHLVAPFMDEIHTPHIIIVPHGTLHFLPFHALHDGEKYLIDKYEISYAPSAAVLKYCLEKSDVPSESPLLMGVADENAPLVEAEISTLSRLFPNARVLLNEGATRAAFTENSRISSFIHIATHAIFRNDNPMFSSFKLADGWFPALDVFSMTCQTNLVTLSGCQSGVSEVTGGDDLLGLMRGFLYAGARSLLLSLWNVNDESTAALMVRFYQEWQQTASKSGALRSAMLAIKDEHPNPFYWAPFFLIGNP